jgi:hypothetical protein
MYELNLNSCWKLPFAEISTNLLVLEVVATMCQPSEQDCSFSNGNHVPKQGQGQECQICSNKINQYS